MFRSLVLGAVAAALSASPAAARHRHYHRHNSGNNFEDRRHRSGLYEFDQAIFGGAPSDTLICRTSHSPSSGWDESNIQDVRPSSEILAAEISGCGFGALALLQPARATVARLR